MIIDEKKLEKELIALHEYFKSIERHTFQERMLILKEYTHALESYVSNSAHYILRSEEED